VSSGNLPHHEDLLDAIPANVYGPPKRNAADRTIICPIFQTQIPKSESRYAVWQKDRTSIVSPRRIGHPMSDGYPGERVRVGRKKAGSGKREGRKEGRKGSGTTWCPWIGPLRQRKTPHGEPYGARRKRSLSYRLTILARAESSISRKQRKQRARKPKARRRGFTAKHGQRFRQEGIRWQSPVSKDCWTVEWIDPASLRKRIFRATGARPRGGLRPRSIRGGKVS